MPQTADPRDALRKAITTGRVAREQAANPTGTVATQATEPTAEQQTSQGKA